MCLLVLFQKCIQGGSSSGNEVESLRLHQQAEDFVSYLIQIRTVEKLQKIESTLCPENTSCVLAYIVN